MMYIFPYNTFVIFIEFFLWQLKGYILLSLG